MVEYPVTRPIPVHGGVCPAGYLAGKERRGVGCHRGNQQNRYYIHRLRRRTGRATGNTAHNEGGGRGFALDDDVSQDGMCLTAGTNKMKNWPRGPIE
jgi:hypothetical protein